MVALGLALGCTAVQADSRGTETRPRAESPRSAQAPAGHGQAFQGKTSYYGHSFAGRRTANGERYEPQALTMAHRRLPFGAWVRVTNLHNQASVVVRVNDRGPFIGNRVADLSHAAAQRLRMLAAGVVQARFEVLPGPPASAPSTSQDPRPAAAASAPSMAVTTALTTVPTTVATTLGDPTDRPPRASPDAAEAEHTAPDVGS